MRQIIETKRLSLREFTLDDVERMYSILSDPVTMQFWPKPFDRDTVQRWVQRSIDAYHEFGFGRYAVILKSTEEVIGDCGLIRTAVNGIQENDLGYIIDNRFWGHGYATEAARACLLYGIETLKMKRIVASMETKHIASKAVAERIGLQFEMEFTNSRNRDLPTTLFSSPKKALLHE